MILNGKKYNSFYMGGKKYIKGYKNGKIIMNGGGGQVDPSTQSLLFNNLSTTAPKTINFGLLLPVGEPSIEIDVLINGNFARTITVIAGTTDNSPLLLHSIAFSRIRYVTYSFEFKLKKPYKGKGIKLGMLGLTTTYETFTFEQMGVFTFAGNTSTLDVSGFLIRGILTNLLQPFNNGNGINMQYLFSNFVGVSNLSLNNTDFSTIEDVRPSSLSYAFRNLGELSSSFDPTKWKLDNIVNATDFQDVFTDTYFANEEIYNNYLKWLSENYIDKRFVLGYGGNYTSEGQIYRDQLIQAGWTINDKGLK